MKINIKKIKKIIRRFSLYDYYNTIVDGLERLHHYGVSAIGLDFKNEKIRLYDRDATYIGMIPMYVEHPEEGEFFIPSFWRWEDFIER